METKNSGNLHGYSERQWDLLRHKVQPDTNEEWIWVQDHADEQLPEEAVPKSNKIAGPEDLSIDELPPPGFEVGQLTKEPPFKKINPPVVMSKRWRGNYNADLTAPKDDQ